MSKKQSGASTTSAVVRAEQLLDSVEQRIKSFFARDDQHLQHIATSLQEKASQAILFPAASEERLIPSSKPQNEPVEPIIKEPASREINEPSLASQAVSEERPVLSPKPQNELVGPVIQEIASKKISERKPASQATCRPREQLGAVHAPLLPSTLVALQWQQEQSLAKVLSILLMASWQQQEQSLTDVLSILLSMLMQQQPIQQQGQSLTDVLSILLMTSWQQQEQPFMALAPTLIAALITR